MKTRAFRHHSSPNLNRDKRHVTRLGAIATKPIPNLAPTTKKVLRLALLALLCLTLIGWSFPARAANRINPQLEEQVLQIIREHPEVLIESVQAYQQQQQEQLRQRQQAFVQQLKINPQGVVGASPTTGDVQSKIVLLEFSDFQCPFCAQAHGTVKQFMAKHRDEVTLAFKHLPLASIHPQAMPAAKAAWAALQQGKFWEYHDALFTQQDKLSEEFFAATARKLNLDIEQFNRDRNSAAADSAIQSDLQLAQNLGISGTPFFVMDGETFTGAIKLSEMEQIFDRIKQPQSR